MEDPPGLVAIPPYEARTDSQILVRGDDGVWCGLRSAVEKEAQKKTVYFEGFLT